MRTLILILLMAIAAYSQTPPIEPGVSQELARWRAARYSDVRYKLNLTLEKMSPVLKGTMEVHVTSMGDPVVPGRMGLQYFHIAPIILDWRKIKGAEHHSTIANVTVNGEKVEKAGSGDFVKDDGKTPIFFEQDEHIIFAYGITNGENVIKLNFTSPILPSGSAITRYIDKEDGSEYIYSLFVPSDASTAFPVFDQPDLKAKFTVSIVAPVEWEVVSNTSLSEIQTLPVSHSREANLKLKYNDFNETKPISTYVFAFAAGPWERVYGFGALSTGGGNPSGSENVIPQSANPSPKSPGTVPTSIYVRKSQFTKFQPHAAAVFLLNREGIKFLEEYFDYKFPFPKYDLVLIPEFPFGGMEHAGATFLRESSVIFPSEPTANDHISRANLIFHEAAHQWFGDTVTMRWFDDLWLKEGFAEFMAYKTLERVMPQYNAWKVFYERNKQAAYLTDSTKGTTPIYQEIKNLSAAKSAYGNIVYRKAPSFLRQAEFYIGPEKFQTAVRAFLKKNEFANAGWEDLVGEFGKASGRDVTDFAQAWVKRPGMPVLRVSSKVDTCIETTTITQTGPQSDGGFWKMRISPMVVFGGRVKTRNFVKDIVLDKQSAVLDAQNICNALDMPVATFPNYQDYGYGIFLLDSRTRDYVLNHIEDEKDEFQRSMMWGALWDSVREGELDPKEYVELAMRNLPTEKDETTIPTILGRASTAMTYYLSDKTRDEIAPRLESLLTEKLRTAPTLGQRITFYRALLNVATTEKARSLLKDILNLKFQISDLKLKTKDRFDIVTRLASLNDPDAEKLLTELEKTETSDDAKRYAYAARAAFPTKESKEKYWNDFVNNKEISESWIEAAFGPFNSVRHADLTLLYLERALNELPNHKRNRKIFFVNGWLAAFIGGQKSPEALAIVNKFLADIPDLDWDLRLKILENVDIIERAVKIRGKYGI